jgi:hypothetical protein
MNNNDQIFLDFWKSYQWPEIKKIFYRLYYDEHGNPIVYSMEDLPGKYIEVTAEQYAEHNYRVIVKNNELIKQAQNFVLTKKLIPSNSGTACYPTDITIVVDTNPNQKWKLKNYDNN